MTNIIEVKDLTKKYHNTRALNNINLNIEAGKVVGILGPNGSGKTTLIKILAGLLQESKGEILIDGHKPGVYSKSIVSYLPDRNFLYDWMKVKDAFELYKDFYKDFDENKGDELLKFMKLEKDMKINSLSKGMKEKLNLTLVLSRKAKLYILDEPTTGLHIDDVKKLLEVLERIVNNGDTVLVIEHNLEVIKMADYIIDLGPDGGDKGGMIVATGTPEEITKVKASYTGYYIKRSLDEDKARKEKLKWVQ